MRHATRLFWTLFVVLALSLALGAQGSLSSQVLQLLTRVNSWTATNTFLDLRVTTGIPSTTTNRFYTDGTTLYFNGATVSGPGGVTTPHNLLSTTHPDTLASAPVRGSVIVANATPAWASLARCASGSYLGSNGTDTTCLTSAASFTAIPAAQITGTASAFVGTAITALNASNLTSGTVPLAQLAGITTTQIAAGAAIPYSKLTLTGGIINADLSASAAIAYSKLALTGALVNGDLTAGTLLFDRWSSNGCTGLQVAQFSGAAWVCKSLAVADVTGAGTVTSVALTLPAILTVTGSPVTTTGTLAATLATQTANLVWAGPNTGAASAPTFRSLVNADLPISGVAAATYPKVTVNTAGVVTAAASQITLTTDVTGTLPRANGGTGVAVSGDDTVLVGSGAAWVATTVPDCVANILSYTQATNLFSCTTFAHNLLSATHGDTLAASPVRGDLIVANSTPAWARIAKGTAGQLLTMGAAATDPSWGNAVIGLTATTAASGSLGSTALPFASVILGTAATNNLSITPASFAQGVVATVDDPGFTTAKVALVKRGTLSYTSGAIGSGACSAAVTATVTGLATTSTVLASLNAAPQTAWKTGVYIVAYPTANTINAVVCNGTAGSISPESTTFNYTAVVP